MTNTTSFATLQIETLAQECGVADATIETLLKAVNSLGALIPNLHNDDADIKTRFAAIEMEVALVALLDYRTKQKELRTERTDYLNATA